MRRSAGSYAWFCLATAALLPQSAYVTGASALTVSDAFSKVQWLGSLATVQADCSNNTGYSTVSLTVTGVPTDLNNWNVTCRLIPWLLAVQVLSAEAKDKQADQREILKQLQNATSASASLVKMVSMNADLAPSGPSPTPEDSKSSTFMARCEIPASPPNTAVFLVAQQNSTGDHVIVTPAVKLERSSIDSVSPLLGPSQGETNVTIMGTGLDESAVCTFSNSTVSVNVSASVLNDSTIVCTTPCWKAKSSFDYLGLGMADNELISLTISSGGCATLLPFQFYSQPQVLGVTPLQGPRYGSFNLTVNLGYSLSSLTDDGMDSMTPSIRIKGGDLNGSDLILSANLTADRMALMAVTPLERAPLATGNHEVHVSLNGQQFANMDSVTSTVLNVEGPTLSFDQPYYQYTQSTETIEIGVVLDGQSSLPVSVQISAAMRLLEGSETLNDTESGLDSSLNQTTLTWSPGENGLKSVEVDLQGNTENLADGGVVVSLESAVNADCSDLKSNSIISGMAQSSLTVGFEIESNQVIYRGDNASLPVNINNAAMRLPASIEYQIINIDGSIPTYIELNETSGVLEWDMEMGDSMTLDIGIDWDNVSYQTQDHLMVQLGDGWNAKASGDQDEVTLHVFGVLDGQCPPGTFRTGKSLEPSPSSFQSAGGWLKTMRVQDAESWFFDLSSPFQADVPEYGVIVPANVSTAQLCLEPINGNSSMTVLDSSGNVMQQVLAPSPAPSLAVGRRLRSQSPGYQPAEGPGIESELYEVLTQPIMGAECNGETVSLPLDPGQNVFSIAHSGTGALGSPSAPPPTPAYLNGTSSGSVPSLSQSVWDMTYSLSVVQLADASHAEMLELTITTSDVTLLACSGVEEDESTWETDIPICSPSTTLSANVSSTSSIIGLQPSLRFPDVQNVRVEIAGQVLSQGGNVGADQLADTSSIVTERSNASFLPVAYIVGLQPGVAVDIPIVVVAEDGVTSYRYTVSIYRNLESSEEGGVTMAQVPAPAPGDGDLESDDSEDYTGDYEDLTISLTTDLDISSPPPPPAIPVSAQVYATWPVPPSRQPQCHICPSGWATTIVDQSHCSMCMPGSFAATSQSPACTDCSNGTYTNTWGSTTCNHCIMGTFAPYQGSRLCFMCPVNMTNIEDGSTKCNVPVQPGTNLATRYAVIVSFGVYLNGTSLETIASKVGVNASSTTILERLISSDTASAFNITARDVNVTGIQQVRSRVLLVNVTATIGLDLPSNFSNGDVQAELAVKNLSADEAINMLSNYPDKFLARTTKALDVTAAQGDNPTSRVESKPKGARGDALLPWYGIVLVTLGAIGVLGMGVGVWRRRSKQPSLLRCWPRKARAYSEFTNEPHEENETEEIASIGSRVSRGLVSRGSKIPTSSDNLPILSQTMSSSGVN